MSSNKDAEKFLAMVMPRMNEANKKHALEKQKFRETLTHEKAVRLFAEIEKKRKINDQGQLYFISQRHPINDFWF